LNISQVYKASVEIAAKTSGGSAIKALNADIATTGKTADAVNKQMAGLNQGLRGLAAGFGAVQVADFISDMARATIQLDAFQAQLKVGFGGANRLELMAIRAEMKALGIAQEESLASAVRFTSAMRLSGQSIGEVNKNFSATSKLILSNKLSAEGAERVYKAMQQVASKGKLMAEELNGQFGDTLAGFTGQLTTAMGISGAELTKRMEDGKVSAEEFFVALRQIGDGIDDAALNSAARSLGNVKNQWFEFKSSVLSAETVRAFLDGTAASFKFLADNAAILTSVVRGLAVAMTGLLVAKAVSVTFTFLAATATRTTAAVVALSFANAHLSMTQLAGLAASNALRAAWTALAANPIGIALTALALIFGALAMRTKAADEATVAYSRAQSSIAGVVDITTGKINTQNAALLENARLLAKTALLKARDAETEARGNFERNVQGTSALIDIGTSGGAAMSGGRQPAASFPMEGRAEVDKFIREMKTGERSSADLAKGWEDLQRRFPGVKREYGELAKEVAAVSTAYLALKDATLQNEIVMGRVSKLSKADLDYARSRGILAADPTTPVAPPKPDDKKASGSTADPYGDRLTALKGEAAKLKFQAEGFGTYGEKVESAEKALMQFEVTSGRFSSLLPAQKQNLLDAAGAVDEWKLKLDAAKAATKAFNDLAEDRTKLQFQIDAFGKYGEKIDSAREASVAFRTSQGDLKGLSDAEKKRLLDEARAVDALAESYDVLKRRKKEQRDLAKAKVDWAGQADDVSFRAQRFTMSDFDYGQAQARREALRQIEQETIGMTAEGAAEYRKARQEALDLLQIEERLEEQHRNTWGGGWREAVRAYGEEVGNIGKQVGDMWTRAFQGTEDALTNLVMTGKADFASLATSILADMARILIRATIMAPFMEFLKSIGMDPSAGQADVVNSEGAKEAAKELMAAGALWGLVALQLKQAAVELTLAAYAATAASVTSSASSGASAVATAASMFGFAKGGAFDQSGIQAFADGGVVSRPTMFRHTGGTGVMGEAGPEAILPLRRINGRLGVASVGAGAAAGPTTVNVEVNVDNRGGTASTSDGSGAKGEALGRLISGVVRNELVEQMRPGGLLSRN
jgi:lambda family phage tail tape measure protein